MPKYLLLKHYRGGPQHHHLFPPMDQWAPEDVEAHMAFLKHVSEKLAEDGIADYIALCRPLIREPGLINRWRSGDTGKATCVSDNGCFTPARAGRGLSCVVEQRAVSGRTNRRELTK